MNELEQIERFFQGEMSATEQASFEKQIQENPQLASAAAFYWQAHQAARLEVLAEKRKQWEKAPAVKPLRKPRFSIAAGIAAVVLLAILWLVWNRSQPNLTERVMAYSNTNFQQLSLTMGNATDSLQEGIILYNQGKFPQAEQIFEVQLTHAPKDARALKFAGITAMRLKNYDKAIQYFQQLSQTDLYENPGPFYEALARIQRNQADDQAKAQQLLKRVVQENLPGKTQATEWLD
ncbi:tetratricopeptide repeat protein [Siphonobacter sp. SORGH_AS_0500]|uniref:tetratricopeptide repeat protein n=1 Tax=Siphonobacter sp. SORGH_AS_0500 TaxID=1864824 RepID=UPI000CB6F8BE|nr:tetratricopeptide repeat protein [Siphonobacter sp. SORGH_AS_0500]MDR6193827.1 tetratricopeptide (TPR) repeat protein [Siphonobacter sp. SORGH_AS_0500]PKK37994.1 hypothetical protein BWI96_02610 [Siphonobacter sp. SORGH_AS_0500]